MENTNTTPCPKAPDFPCWLNDGTWYRTAGCDSSQILHLELLPNSHRREEHDSTGSKRPVNRQYCRNCACINTKSVCIIVGDVLLRHLHLVCWCKCKNEGLPHRCAAASPPGTGPAHSVGLPKSRLLSRLPQAASLDLTCLTPVPQYGLSPKPHLAFTQHSWESYPWLQQLCQFSVTVLSQWCLQHMGSPIWLLERWKVRQTKQHCKSESGLTFLPQWRWFPFREWESLSSSWAS